LYIRSQKIPCRIHLSGEFGEINSQMADFLEEMEICRVIFHRKNTVEDMKSCISNLKKNIEYEAFVLNELCHFSGGFCNSLHCDELGHLCRVPYRVGKLNKKCKGVLELSKQKADEVENEDLDVENYRTGAGGCGLCALYDLQKAGITYLKIVGRGNYTEFMQQDIIRLKKALMILETAETKREFRDRMKQELFPDGCSQNCYY
jgi:putative protease